MPTAEGTVNGRKVEILRDRGCTCCTVKRRLVSDDQLIGKESYVTLIDETTQKYPLAVIELGRSVARESKGAVIILVGMSKHCTVVVCMVIYLVNKLRI